MNARLVYAISLAVFLTSCERYKSEPVETVMCPGNVIEYQASNGRNLTITATDTTEREYALDKSLKFKVRLTPRPTRWYGARGLYRPVGVGGTHMVLDEAVQHFSAIEEANDWVRFRLRADDGKMASIDDAGLLVMWTYSTRPSGIEGGPDAILSVDVYQLLVDLKTPRGLVKVSDDVVIKQLAGSCNSRNLEPQYVPSKPAVLNGRMYSGRVLDVMRERGYDSTDVERVIANGRKTRDGAVTVYYFQNSKPFDTPLFVDVDADGRVVSIP